jgi:ribosome recycling factor
MIHSLEERMKKSIAALKSELATVRTGRANVSLLDHVTVDYYGSEMPLSQVATLSVPEPRMIMIAPWEKNMLPVIEKAILSSDLGLNPSNDGAMIRIVLPELTEERRKEFVKQVRQYGEKAKVAVRNIRRDANDDIKRQAKDEGISEDESKRLVEQVQKVTDRYIHDIDQIIEHKEKDILTI